MPKKEVECVTLQVLDDEFNNNTADRKEYINSFIHFSVADLNEDDENVIHNFIKLVEKFSSN